MAKRNMGRVGFGGGGLLVGGGGGQQKNSATARGSQRGGHTVRAKIEKESGQGQERRG